MDAGEWFLALGFAGLIVVNIIVLVGLFIIFYVVSGLIVDYLGITGLYGLISRITVVLVGVSMFVSPINKNTETLLEQ